MVVIDVFLVYLGINIYRAKYLSDDSATHIRQMYIPTFLGFSGIIIALRRMAN